MMTTRRVVRILDRIIDYALSLVFLVIMCIGAYIVYDTGWVYYHTEADIAAYRFEKDNPEVAARLSDEAIGWITIDDTKIDYPLMQGEDNSEYLNKNPYGEYALSGSIFLDSRNASDFTDEYSLIYGHHMANDMMFGALDHFKDEKYFNEHRSGTLTVGDKDYKLKLYAFMTVDASEETIFDPDCGADVITFVRQNATIFLERGEGRTIALSTCKSPFSTQRTVVFGVIGEE